jgi:dTDP-4-amino-4,6-dideoxygalactose transaminase
MARIDIGALAEGWTRNRVIAAIAAEGVPCFFGSCAEIYREQAFTAAGLGPATRLPGARAADETSIAFLTHPTLTRADMEDVAAAAAKVMAVAAPPR